MNRIDELEKALVKEPLEQVVRITALDPKDCCVLVVFEMPVGKILVKARGGEIRGTKFSAPIRRELEEQVLKCNASLRYIRVAFKDL